MLYFPCSTQRNGFVRSQPHRLTELRPLQTMAAHKTPSQKSASSRDLVPSTWLMTEWGGRKQVCGMRHRDACRPLLLPWTEDCTQQNSNNRKRSSTTGLWSEEQKETCKGKLGQDMSKLKRGHNERGSCPVQYSQLLGPLLLRPNCPSCYRLPSPVLSPQYHHNPAPHQDNRGDPG